jgi:hypothetical protein
MSEANASTTNTASATEAMPSLDERIDSVFGPSDPAGEGGSPPPPASDAASPAGSEASDPLAQARAERRAKLAELNAKSRAQVDAKTAVREAEQLRKQLADAEARTKAYESYVDPSKLTKEQFFDLAAQNPNLTAQELGSWLREQMADPSQAAVRAARSAVDPEIARLQAKLDETSKKLESFVEQQQTVQQRAAEDSAHQQLAAFTAENAATSPYAASFLQAYGPEEFRKVVEAVLPNVVGGGAQAVLDDVEDLLLSRHKQLTAWNPGASPANQRPQATIPRTNHAAAQAPTHVTNTLAQQRSSVVDEAAELAKMSLEERAAIAFGF